jgi:NAD(P)H-hydrate epimerase
VVFPDGSAAINPTGTPALAKGGSGDILTGMIAGLMAQHPHRWRDAVRAAVWLHGRAGEIAAASSAEPCVIATDLLRALPEAVNELRHAL